MRPPDRPNKTVNNFTLCSYYLAELRLGPNTQCMQCSLVTPALIANISGLKPTKMCKCVNQHFSPTKMCKAIVDLHGGAVLTVYVVQQEFAQCA